MANHNNHSNPGGHRRFTTVRYSVRSIIDIVDGPLDEDQISELSIKQKQLMELKKKITVASKKNFTLERDIRNLDKKIALLIRNRISLEEVMAQSGDISLINETTTFGDKQTKAKYGKLFYILQQDTRYIARLATYIKLAEIDNLLQTVMFTLYGNQYDEFEEHLLLSMFQQVLEHEFSNAKGLSGVLRANTALTRMMTTYTRRAPGQHYLKKTLTDPLRNITENPNIKLEMNPLKVYEQMINDYESNTGKTWTGPRKISQEEANDNIEVKQLIAERIDKLGEITDMFVSNLIDSIDDVPYGIRWICKQIKALLFHYFEDATSEQACSMIGGFFLLRFVNPAIVTPQAFMLVETKLSSVMRRNLTLLAKIMQNLSNNVSFGGVKEYFMAPLNVVLDRNRARLNNFLTRITEVDSLSDHLSMDRYIALAKTETITLNISLNEMYFIHNLLKRNEESLVGENSEYSTEDHEAMRNILQNLGEAPPQLPRKENANVDLDLDKTAKGDGQEIYSADQLYAETKYLLFALLKNLPKIYIQQGENFAIEDVFEQAYQKINNEAILESIDRIKQNIELLCEENILTPDDDFYKLRKDTINELLNDEEQLTVKAQKDLDKLDQVLQAIKDHHLFLEEQFDAYKEYLTNVRQNCNSKISKKEKKKQDKENKKKQKQEKKSNKKNKKDKKDKKDKKGPFKYSHSQLEKQGIIIESEVPEDRRSSIFFVFSSSSPGIFNVVVMFSRRHISKISLQLDELLEMQHASQLEYETEFLTLNVNLLLYLLNRDFVS